MKAAVQMARRQSGQEPFHLVHQILVLDAFLKERLDDLRYQTITRRFIDELLNVLDMQALGDLGIYPAVDQRAPGWSFIQPITTSHVSAHYFEKPGRMPHIRLDAYSCDSIDWSQLISVCHRHFGLGDWHATFIDRQIDPGADRRVVDLTGAGERITSRRVLSPSTPMVTGGRQCTASATVR